MEVFGVILFLIIIFVFLLIVSKQENKNFKMRVNYILDEIEKRNLKQDK